MDLLNFTNYGTNDNPLYKAKDKDIGDLLGIKKIRRTLENIKTMKNIKL
jgi:hypothetical protein